MVIIQRSQRLNFIMICTYLIHLLFLPFFSKPQKMCAFDSDQLQLLNPFNASINGFNAIHYDFYPLKSFSSNSSPCYFCLVSLPRFICLSVTFLFVFAQLLIHLSSFGCYRGGQLINGYSISLCSMSINVCTNNSLMIIVADSTKQSNDSGGKRNNNFPTCTVTISTIANGSDLKC